MSDNLATVTEPVEVLESAQSENSPLEDVLVEDVLVEEVSIDGMCGVY